MEYYIKTTIKLGSEGKFFLRVKNPFRTHLYKRLKRENVPFTMYSFTNFYDEKTFKTIETYLGGAK